MLSWVLAIVVFNLALGYAAAAALAEPPLWAGLYIAWPRLRRPQPERGAADSGPNKAGRSSAATGTFPADLSGNSSGLPLVAGLDELPADWLALLAAQGIVAESFVEATTHILRLEIGRYREQLVAGESAARSLTTAADASGLVRLANQLRTLNQDWLDKQTAAADLLGQRAGRLGDHEQTAAALEQVLLDQAAHIRSVCGALEGIDAAGDVEAQGKSLIEQTMILLAQTHALRDRMVDLLAVLMRSGQSLANCPVAVQRDFITGLPNRVGLEALLATWWQADERRTRPLCAVLIDIDRCGRINQRIGTRAGDRALVATARLIEEVLVKDRGFERLARVGGQAFLILLGDVGPHQALTTAERLRQAIEATTLEMQGAEFDLSVSCGAIEVGQTESSLDLVRRAEGAMRFAKKAGRNRCALDKGDGPAMIDPPQFPVKARVIVLDEIALPTATA